MTEPQPWCHGPSPRQLTTKTSAGIGVNVCSLINAMKSGKWPARAPTKKSLETRVAEGHAEVARYTQQCHAQASVSIPSSLALQPTQTPQTPMVHHMNLWTFLCVRACIVSSHFLLVKCERRSIPLLYLLELNEAVTLQLKLPSSTNHTCTSTGSG